MRSEGFPFIVGILGVGPLFASSVSSRRLSSSLVLSRRLSSFVVVCRRLSSSRRNSVPMGKVAEGVFFGGFKCDVATFRGAGVALCDMRTCFVTCRRSFCVAGAILLRCFQNMSCIFRDRHSTLDVSIVIFRGRRNISFQTRRVACFLRIALAGLRPVATRCKFRGRHGPF